MEHFASETWTDFVRGVSVPGTASAIEAHLASGCLECKAYFQTWHQVLTFSGKERTYTPSEDVVRLVKLGFTNNAQERSQSWQLGALVFDSMNAAVPAGIRSAAMTARQVVYEGEGLTVDLRFDRQGVNKICVSGQVLDRHTASPSIGNTAVVLWTDDGRLLATTEANEFGEFQLEFQERERLRLSIAMAGRRTLRISLGSLSISDQ